MQNRNFIEPGDFFLHYKGNAYEVLLEAKSVDTGDPLVIYRSVVFKDSIWARRKEEFLSEVSPGKPRFSYLGRNLNTQTLYAEIDKLRKDLLEKGE